MKNGRSPHHRHKRQGRGNSRYRGWFSEWGTAVLHQGDSRQLADVVGIGAMDAAISSAPFENTTETKDVKFRENLSDRSKNWNGATRAAFDYGSTPGDVGNDTGASF